MKAITLIVLLLINHIAYAQNQSRWNISRIEPDKFLGRWYEIATCSTGVQRDCRCTTIDFDPVAGKKYVRMNTRCVRFKNGKFNISRTTGKAFFLEGSSKFRIQYIWPVNRNYHIVGVANDYSWAIVGHPQRKYLRILYREAFMPTQTYDLLLSLLRDQGFEVNRLVKISQHCDIY
jgi:apolipoprotein D and lipocalin family protein